MQQLDPCLIADGFLNTFEILLPRNLVSAEINVRAAHENEHPLVPQLDHANAVHRGETVAFISTRLKNLVEVSLPGFH